jgi:hypothetical protein
MLVTREVTVSAIRQLDDDGMSALAEMADYKRVRDGLPDGDVDAANHQRGHDERGWGESHFAALTTRNLVRRTGSGSPSTKIIRCGWWDVRPTMQTP